MMVLGARDREINDKACEHCGVTTGCDCVARIGCSRQGQPGHHQCGKCRVCGTPRFKNCAHEKQLT